MLALVVFILVAAAARKRFCPYRTGSGFTRVPANDDDDDAWADEDSEPENGDVELRDLDEPETHRT